MQLVLTEDVDNLGRAGEQVHVRDGYGRNFLVPRGLALMATKQNLKRIEHERKIVEFRVAKQRKDSQAVADRINKAVVQLRRKVGEQGKLYGSVTAQDIGEALAQQGIEIDRRKLVLPDALRQLGDVELPLKLPGGVEAVVHVKVVAEES